MTAEQIINKILIEQIDVSRETLKEPRSVYMDEDTYKVLKKDIENRCGFWVRNEHGELKCLGLVIFIVEKPGHKLKNYIEVR